MSASTQWVLLICSIILFVEAVYLGLNYFLHHRKWREIFTSKKINFYALSLVSILFIFCVVIIALAWVSNEHFYIAVTCAITVWSGIALCLYLYSLIAIILLHKKI